MVLTKPVMLMVMLGTAVVSVDGVAFNTNAELKTAVAGWIAKGSNPNADYEANSKNYGKIANWDVSKVTDMSELFKGKKTFNADISNWDVGKVTTMFEMFSDASAFNRDISKWNTVSVTSMARMFHGASKFNGDISKWNTAQVTFMDDMFYNANVFNGDVSNWKVHKVRSMKNMFKGAAAFSANIFTLPKHPATNMEPPGSVVTNMEGMFMDAKAFAGDVSKWDTSKVTNMKNMFNGAAVFTKIFTAKKSTEAVTDTSGMFFKASLFNGDVTNWDMSEVTITMSMFDGASAFNRDVSKWQMPKLKAAGQMFKGATKFNWVLDTTDWGPDGGTVEGLKKMCEDVTALKDDCTCKDETGKGCQTPPDPKESSKKDPEKKDDDDDSGGLSGGAIAGIVIASLAFVGVGGYLYSEYGKKEGALTTEQQEASGSEWGTGGTSLHKVRG